MTRQIGEIRRADQDAAATLILAVAALPALALAPEALAVLAVNAVRACATTPGCVGTLAAIDLASVGIATYTCGRNQTLSACTAAAAELLPVGLDRGAKVLLKHGNGPTETLTEATLKVAPDGKRTVEVVQNGGYHSNGLRTDFYDANGNPVKWKNPLTGAVEDIPAGVTFHRDHILPKNEIKRMVGFENLTPAQQNQILNDPANLQPLNGSMNCSKGCTVNGTAHQWDTYKGQPVNADYKYWLAEQQADMRAALQRKIKELQP